MNKRTTTRLRVNAAATLAILFGTILCSCESLLGPSEKAMGTLEITFGNGFIPTKTTGAVPDTNDFILSVTNASGTSIYYGPYNQAPASLLVSPGSYTVSAKSCEFSEPMFDLPQYGDTQVTTVRSGEKSYVELNCSMINSGIRLVVGSDFLSDFSDGVMYLKAKAGRVMYSFAEKRTAYFLPGSVSLILSRSGKETTLFTRILEEQQILTVKLSSAGSSASATNGISINVDTTKTYLNENFTYGESDDGRGKDKDNAMSVTQARSDAPANEVWVYGYIVGGDLSSSKCSFKAPFTSRTNLVLAAKSNCTDKNLCLSVQLASGDLRDELNLVDHPDLLGRKVFLYGDLVASYYGIPGIQCISEYEFD